MIIDWQANIGTEINPIQYSFNNIIFCNEGGKETMSLVYKNIPPMKENDIPNEIQVINTTGENVYKKIISYDKNCQLNILCTDEIPFFRFQIIYDGYGFLYYPEFKLYERPYLLLESNISAGTNILTITKSLHDSKNLNYLSIGESILFKDYNTEYTINNIVDNTLTYSIYLDRDLEEDYIKNDILIFNNSKYELQLNSNLLNDSTVNDLSPFKFKFINLGATKNYYLTDTIGSVDNFTLINNNYDDFVDLQSDDKYASISNNVDIEYSTTIALNTNLTTSDITMELTGEPDVDIDLYTYITIESSSGIEIVKVTTINSNVNFTIDRGQLGTSVLNHNSGEALVYFSKNIYHLLLPYNKEINYRYVQYRNVDFILNQV